MMDRETFKRSLDGAAPPGGLPALMQALWLAAKCGGKVDDNWHAAHAIAQDDTSADGSWVHAHLHRIEGDLANAGYWYRQAGKPKCSGPLAEEWAEIVGAILR